MKAIWGVLALAMTVPAMAQYEASWDGPWETNQGRMDIEQHGDRVRGAYDLNDGRVFGDSDGTVFRGIWSQSTSKRRCYEDRDGTHYWGRFTLTLSDDGRYFHGRWWYCDRDPNDGGEWTGHRPHRRR
jgi:hypothetical protein